MLHRCLLLLYLLLPHTLAFAQETHFLCGSDEDGCSSDNYAWCFCIPEDGPLAAQAYCLDFDTIACKPLSQTQHCPHTAIFHNQAECLAVAFQSEAQPGCLRTHADFCHTHHIPVCAIDGGIATCHATP